MSFVRGWFARHGAVVIVGGLCVAQAACNALPPCDGATLEHPAGFSVCRDRGVVQAVKLDDGYQFLLKPVAAGASDEITVRVTPADPHTEDWKEKAIDGRTFWWFTQTEKAAGNAGGDEHTLSIYAPVGDENILVVRRVRAAEKLDAESTWNLARSVKPLAAKR